MRQAETAAPPDGPTVAKVRDGVTVVVVVSVARDLPVVTDSRRRSRTPPVRSLLRSSGSQGSPPPGPVPCKTPVIGTHRDKGGTQTSGVEGPRGLGETVETRVTPGRRGRVDESMTSHCTGSERKVPVRTVPTDSRGRKRRGNRAPVPTERVTEVG